jgi:hypothetical protein
MKILLYRRNPTVPEFTGRNRLADCGCGSTYSSNNISSTVANRSSISANCRSTTGETPTARAFPSKPSKYCPKASIKSSDFNHFVWLM